MKAHDIMTRKVVCVNRETPVPEIAELLLNNHISGVPVVDEKMHVVGIVSEGDLLRRVELGTEKHRGRLASFFTSVSRSAEEFARARGLRAEDVMTEAVFSIPPDMSLMEIVDVLEKRGVKRLPVVTNNRLVGIVTRANLVRALVALPRAKDKPGASNDVAIKAQLIDELNKHPWGHRPASDVVVTDGVVHFWGLCGSTSEFKALRVCAEAVPGVKSVVDHMIVVEPGGYVEGGLFVA